MGSRFALVFRNLRHLYHGGVNMSDEIKVSYTSPHKKALAGHGQHPRGKLWLSGLSHREELAKREPNESRYRRGPDQFISRPYRKGYRQKQVTKFLVLVVWGSPYITPNGTITYPTTGARHIGARQKKASQSTRAGGYRCAVAQINVSSVRETT